ncbi:hypothetical protein COR50_20875 [Chitinophaga caeni]|uniref:N-acetylmuramoyl-L-alanine amidase n=1 Tax=Chitinophaga caeni TaxID=2029983 RepID=A0A291QZU2_9BACT|nr:N-acetylmuramoyl-L-alanine amidase [Chitinophaga caeni]ATL49431.1 hypothetical protein COR50_20875 [Chitinophaga caeni]
MSWKRLLIAGCSILGLLPLKANPETSPVLPGDQEKPIKTIVIDAGHGGKDHGAIGSYSSEKEVTLAVALKLGKLLEEKMPDVKIYYTRKDDRFDDARLKAKKANEAHGDLFISIHCNSAPKIRKRVGYKTVYRKKKPIKVAKYAYYPNPAKGTETYIWATDRNTAKMESMRGLSSVIMLDANSEESKQVLDTNDPETYIMLATLRNAFFDQSLKLSMLIEDEFTKVGRNSRGARQRNEKGIWVLQATAMPSVLVELGFLSNPDEEKYLNSQDGQNELANGIYRAVKRYKEELEKFSSSPTQNAPVTKNTGEPKAKAAYTQPSQTQHNQFKTQVNLYNEHAPAAKNTKTATATQYGVQLLVSSTNYNTNSSKFKKLGGHVMKETIRVQKKKRYKYTLGPYISKAEAQAAIRKAQRLGFKDAFLVALND